MNIQHHIKTLLYRHDCVIVKGFGGFVCQHHSAQLKDGIFFPPYKSLTFNQSLNKGDGLLANHIAKEEKVSYQIAQQKIYSFTQRILETLDSEKEIHFSQLGSFQKNKEGKLVFEPDTSQDWLIAAYGLPKFEVNSIPVEKVIPVVPLTEVNTKDKSKKAKPSYWKYAAVGLVAIGLSGFLGSEIYQDQVYKYNLAQQEKADKLIDQKIQKSSFVISEPLSPIAIDIKPKEPKRYHIVAGAFRIKANADKKIQQLQAKGFDAHYIGANSYGLHQVVYKSFSDKTEAIISLKSIKATESSSAWLFVKEILD